MNFQISTDEMTGETYLDVEVRGSSVLHDAFLNKGDAFTRVERDELALRGLLPDHVASIEDQLMRVRVQFDLKSTEISKNVYLNGLMDRNETLFYRFVLENLKETVPIIYTPTIAQTCAHWSRIYRRAHGLYITPRDRGSVVDVLRERPVLKPPVIVVTDNERILGIGDQGAGGMGIPIGKLALYTAAAGIHPERCIPVSIDVGTNNAELLDDPLYVGYRHSRLRGEEYEGLVDEFVDAVRELYPDALLQWEDFANKTSFRNLATHRDRIASFNDDIQGTAAMVVAGVITATRHLGFRSESHRVVIAGAGSAGHGIAKQLAFAFVADGVDPEVARNSIFVLDSRGLLIAGDRVKGIKADLAAGPDLLVDWDVVEDPPSLLDVVRNVKPTILVGVSGQAGLFSRDVVTEMGKHVDNPIILPLSNPTNLTEVTPANAVKWTQGRAIVATGSPFSPVDYEGTIHRIGQANNVFIFPGIGLAVVAVKAHKVTDGMFLEAAKTLAIVTDPSLVDSGQLYPNIGDVRVVSRAVALAVAKRAIEEGVADPVDDLEATIDAEMWFPDYVSLRAH